MISNIFTLLVIALIFYIEYSAPDELSFEEEWQLSKDVLKCYVMIIVFNIIGLILGV
jgi:hypothetical protein